MENKRKIKIAPLFKKDLKTLDEDGIIAVKRVLEQGHKEDIFRPGRKFKVLRNFKGYKIWYLRAGSDIRLTATYDSNGDIWLLSIESHDSLKNAHKRVIQQVRSIKR